MQLNIHSLSPTNTNGKRNSNFGAAFPTFYPSVFPGGGTVSHLTEEEVEKASTNAGFDSPEKSPEKGEIDSNGEKAIPFRRNERIRTLTGQRKSRMRTLQARGDGMNSADAVRRRLSLQLGESQALMEATAKARIRAACQGERSPSKDEPKEPESTKYVAGCGRKRTWIRRNSQKSFADRSQTVFVFDWDDTLFPTTYVEEDSGLKYRCPYESQTHMTAQELNEVKAKLDECDESAERLLHCATGRGSVIIVTLARPPWISQACRCYFPKTQQVLEDKQVVVVYAQEGNDVPPPKSDENDDAKDRYWGLVKGRAIAREVDKFYSQYEGQSWKNILSFGDSAFERYGTLSAAHHYVRKLSQTDNGAESPKVELANKYFGALEGLRDGHYFKLRAKVLKMLDDPTPEELWSELGLLERWLPLMVALDNGFDMELVDLTDDSVVQIERQLVVDSEGTSQQQGERVTNEPTADSFQNNHSVAS